MTLAWSDFVNVVGAQGKHSASPSAHLLANAAWYVKYDPTSEAINVRTGAIALISVPICRIIRSEDGLPLGDNPLTTCVAIRLAMRSAVFCGEEKG